MTLRGVRRLASLLILVFLVSTLLPQVPAAAAEAALTEEEAIAILQEYEIVRGDTSGNLLLNDRLTRAQAAALFVRSMTANVLAALLKDVVPFTDAKGHWAAGEIAMAERLGLMKGSGAGLFRPDDPITYAEIYTVLLRMVDQEPTGPWDPRVIEARAVAVGIAAPGVNRSDTAIRLKVFWSLASTLSQVPVKGDSNLLREHLDHTPPTLSLSQTSFTTRDARVTITGTAVGAHRVLVNGTPAQYNRQTGSFTATVLVDTSTNTFLIEAYDAAKNKAVRTVTVERQADIARLVITGPNKIAVGSSQQLEIKALDSRGTEVPLEGVTADVTGNVATLDLATSRLRGTAIGRGTLTLTSGRVRATFSFDVLGPSTRAASLKILDVNGGYAPALNKETTVVVQVLDANGRVATDDNFRTIALQAAGLTGVSITVANAATQAGVSTFTVKGVKEGSATFTATTEGLDSVSQQVQFLASPRIVLSSTIKSLKPDGTSSATIKATLTDDSGKAVNNTSKSDIQIEVREAGTDGDMTQAVLTIARGRAASTGSATYLAGIAPGTAQISGTIVSDHTYPVQTLYLPVTDPLAGVKLDIIYSPASPRPGDPVNVTLRVLDSSNRIVTAGSYAFQVKLTTSNNDPVSSGFPDGVELAFKNSAYYPVDDQRPVTDPSNDPYSITGRTDRGIAEMTLTYNRSGVVEITPVPVGLTQEAYSPTLGVGPASGSTGLYAPTANIVLAGTPTAVVVTVDSVLGKDQPGGAVNSAIRMILRAKVVDDQGGPVPRYQQTATLTRTSQGQGVTQVDGINRKTTVDGVVEFTIRASNSPGFDRYTVSVGTFTSAPITVAVHLTPLPAPQVIAIRGVKEGSLSPVTGFVGPDADYMDIQLASQEAVDPAEPTNWVVAKVYRKGESRPFFTSQAFDLNSPLPLVQIPRSVLRAGTYDYEVQVNSGAGDSPKSPAFDSTSRAMVADYYSSYRLTTASFDAATGKLVVGGSGLSSNGSLKLDKLSIVKGNAVVPLDDPSVTFTITSSSITFMLGDLAASISPDTFHGNSVYVEAQAGWFTNPDGSLIAMAYPQVPVRPMAVIHSGSVDQANKRLYLNGEGFKHGTLAYNLIGIAGDSGEPVYLRPGTSTSHDRVLSVTETQIIFNLSQATLDAINALPGANLYVTAQTGWLYTGSATTGSRVGAITGTNHPVYSRVVMSSASFEGATNTLVLRGSGLNGVTLDPAKLRFMRTTTSVAWSPTRTGPIQSTSDTEIRIQFHADDAAEFRSLFDGRNVYINTAPGWMTDAAGREVLTLPDYSILFTVRAS